MQTGSSVNQNTACLHLATSADFSTWITDWICLSCAIFKYVCREWPGATSTRSGGFSFEKHFQSYFTNQRYKSTYLTSAPQPVTLHLSCDSSGEGGGVLRDVDLRMQTRWLDCVYIILSSDHNASWTTSGPGHADWITFRSEARLHLSFQCVCGQHLDTGHMLMPSVNAAIVCDFYCRF